MSTPGRARRLPEALAGFVRPRADFEAAYVSTLASGELGHRVELAIEELGRCRLCPRHCDIDRLQDERAVCKTGRRAKVASAAPHFGEEDCLRGSHGSGTIFFSYCNLRCVFCQNFDLSWEGYGREMDPPEIAELMLALQDRGCHNINFVTPEHVVPQVLEAVYTAARRGLRIPIVYNTSAYDSLRSIELLDGVVDIYMPDFKVWEETTSRKILLAPDYPRHARRAIRAMHRQVGDLVVDEEGRALRGLLVRHLVLPGGVSESGEILQFLATEISPDTYVNIMDQYAPAGLVARRPGRYRELSRRVTGSEIVTAERLARAAGLHRFDTRWREPAALFHLATR